MSRAQPILRQGEVVRGETERWKVLQKIGEGQFSEVYQVLELSTQQQRALKIERKSATRTVELEWNVLTKLQDKCKQSLRVHHRGEHPVAGSGSRPFFVMDLLGSNLSTVRKSALLPGGRADFETAKVIAAAMLRALEDVHRAGHIHRDVKPANFCMSPPDATDLSAARWVLVDFGLAKPYLDEGGQPVPERPEASFRGSTTYASVNCLQLQDQSRRDDLWGWLYCLVELLEGTLPWRDAGEEGRERDKEAVLAAKLACLDQPQRLFSSQPCPKAIVDLSNYLCKLTFGDGVDFNYLRRKLNELDSGALVPPVDVTLAAAACPLMPPPPPPAANGTLARVSSSDGRSAVVAASDGGGSRSGQPSRAASPGAVAALVEETALVIGRDAQPPAQPQQQQQQQAGASDLSKQRSRDPSRQRRGRGCTPSRGRSEDRSRDRSRLEGSRSRSRSRSRGRGSRSRERKGRRHSRDRYTRSRSRGRDGYGGRSQRSRSRDRRRSRRSSHDRSRRRRSRTRSRHRQRRRSTSRSRSRSPRGGAQQQRRREERSAPAPGTSPAAGQVPAAVGGGADVPTAALKQQQPQQQQQAANGEDGGLLHALNSQPGVHDRYRSMLQCVLALRSGALSEPAAAACQQLRGLEPAEGLGVLCWLLDELATATEPKHLPAVAAFCEEVAAFAIGTGKRCVERAHERAAQQLQEQVQQRRA